MSSYPYATKLPECASDRSISAIPADPDIDGYDGEDEDYGHDGMTLQQDDLNRNRYRPTVNGGITEPDDEAYVAARCRCVVLCAYIDIF